MTGEATEEGGDNLWSRIWVKTEGCELKRRRAELSFDPGEAVPSQFARRYYCVCS